MARLTGIVALLAVALFVADAYAYRTTITTVEVDGDNQGKQQRCSQIRAREDLRSCDQMMKMQMQNRDVLQMRGMEDPQKLEEMFTKCCRELRNVDEQCRCDMLEEITKDEQKQARGQKEVQMLERAKYLPSLCGLRPQQCNF